MVINICIDNSTWLGRIEIDINSSGTNSTGMSVVESDREII